jgi:hypothetical protein
VLQSNCASAIQQLRPQRKNNLPPNLQHIIVTYCAWVLFNEQLALQCQQSSSQLTTRPFMLPFFTNTSSFQDGIYLYIHGKQYTKSPLPNTTGASHGNLAFCPLLPTTQTCIPSHLSSSAASTIPAATSKKLINVCCSVALNLCPLCTSCDIPPGMTCVIVSQSSCWLRNASAFCRSV